MAQPVRAVTKQGAAPRRQLASATQADCDHGLGRSMKAQLAFSGHQADLASDPMNHGHGPDSAHDVISLFSNFRFRYLTL
jgi:hypothetical protein